MDKRPLIELLEGLTDSQHDVEKKRDALLERCLSASKLELEEFLDDLSQLLGDSPGTYLPTLKTFTLHLRNKFKSPLAILKFNLQTKWNTSLPNFTSQIIIVVIKKNLRHSNISGFGELLRNCVELLWSTEKPANDKDNNKQLAFYTMEDIFSSILDEDGTFEALVLGASGRHCIKSILFDFGMINRIEREKLLKAVDMVAALVGKWSEHEEQLSKSLSVYKSCTALLETLRSRQSLEKIHRKNSLPPTLDDMFKLDDKEFRTQPLNRKRAVTSFHASLSVEDEQHFMQLGMKMPQRPADLPHFLRDLEQRKIGLFQDLIEFVSYSNCFLEEDSASSECLFRLPFEFNNNDRLGPWDILLSEDTIDDLRQLKSPLAIKAITKKLGQISSGEWGKHGLQREIQTYGIPVYEVEIPNNDSLKMLWQVDYGFSISKYSHTQLVKIWAVTDNQEHIREILESLSIVHQVYTSKQSHWCVVEQVSKDDIIIPMTLRDEEEAKSSQDKLHNSYIDDERLLRVHKMLITNKFVPLSTNLFKSLALGGVNFTFQVSKEEYEIINSPTSAIVIGRSGTGKTTCIVFRQVTSYLNSKLFKSPSLCDDDRDFCKRQIFITVSSNLRHRVKGYFYRLRESAELAGEKMSMKRFHECIRNKGEDIDVTNYIMPDDEERELDEIPNSFHHLTDDHFPLFITCDKFSKMLQGTYGINNQNLTVQQKFDSYEEEEEEFHQRSSFLNISNQHFVDYKAFQKKYWPRLNSYCKQKFDCELVYSEFSIIKGTNPEVDCLSREAYRDISSKKYSAFCYNRDEIYNLFELYEKAKSRNGDYDSIDRTLAILRCAKTKALGGPHIHEIYIDECQDNQIVDLSLIFKVFNRADAIFLAGDIAQCIARGSSFRFEDLRDLMYKWELNRAKSNNNKRDSIKPKQFELNVNYRSHNGILQLASSVVDLIWKFFPSSIDKPSSEHGEIGGPRPIIFDGLQEKHFKVFSAGENAENHIEFGAEQVIIVRNDETKSRIKKLIGKAGLVMTVFEAKGMEFSDVLLFNFFNDSPAEQKWRVISGSLPFSHEKHYILSSELKHLYVAITRARQHIWICDEDTECSMPIRVYWEHHGLIKVTQSVNEINTFSTLAKKSNSREWDQQGKNFFEQQQYEQAIFCFEKSGNKKNHELASAYYLRQIARDSINDSDDNTIKNNFVKAAKAFIKCSCPNQAALCYQDISMWHEAGEQFEIANEYTSAVVAYKNDNDYKKVIDLMQKHRQKIDGKIFHRITRLVNIYYRRENNKEMSEKALSILPTQEEKIKLLKDHAPEEVLEFCEKIGEFSVAAEDLCSRGEFEKAVEKFICSDKDKDIIRALQCLLHLCRFDVLKKTLANISNPSTSQELSRFLSKKNEIVSNIKPKSLISLEKSDQWNWKSIIEEFQLYSAYLEKNLNRIYKCIEFFKKNGEFITEFRAINIWLQVLQSDIQVEYWNKRLQCLLRLCDLAFLFIAPRRNDNTDNIGKVNKNFENIFFVNEVENCSQKCKIFFDNPLVVLIDEMHKNIIKDVTDNWYVYDIYIVHQTISKFLASYIYELIWKANQEGRTIPDIGYQICHKFTSCQQQSNCWKHHVIPTPSILHQRMTLAFLQYSVMLKLNVLYSRRLLEERQSREVRGLQRWWAERLIMVHIRYQSPQISCSEVIHMTISRLPYHTRNGLIDLAYKEWLLKEFHVSNFEVMLKCMFIFQQLRDKWAIDKFYWEMKKTRIISHPNMLQIGFEYSQYNGYHQAIPVGKRLSLFFFSLYSNHVIDAISNIKVFTQYAIDNTQNVKLITNHAFSDLVFLMEFTMSLIFTASPRYCDFCLPRSYLVNYFNAFTAKPLIQSQHDNYNRENYLAAIKDSINQIRNLLIQMINSKQAYFTIIMLRLIRLLVLIGLNEPTIEADVLNLFKFLNNNIFSIRMDRVFYIITKKYLEGRSMGHLVNTLCDDLKETGCDSLVVVYYNLGGLSRFSNPGMVKLTYTSIKEFHTALQQIKSQVIIEERGTSVAVENQQRTKGNEQSTDPIPITFVGDNDNEDEVSEETQELTTEIQAWFQKIHDSPKAQKAAKKIQTWLRWVYDREKSRQLNYDPILNKIYNKTVIFCQDMMKRKGKKAVYRYNIHLRGRTVNVVVELIKLQGSMDATKNKLQKSINNSSDTNKIESGLELEDELRYEHREKVKQVLESLSITENSEKHEETNIRWLKNELQQANDIIEQVKIWIDKCKDAMKFRGGYNYDNYEYYY